MDFSSILQLARDQIELRVQKQDIVIDATIGNGHDTLFLAQLLDEEGIIYGFDIQSKAIEVTQNKLQQMKNMQFNQTESPFPMFHLFQANHANMNDYIEKKHHGQISAIMFNLGYMPGSDHLITTEADSTLIALQASIRLLRKGGMISIMVYTGHPAGGLESKAVTNWASLLPQKQFHVVQYQAINQMNNPPYWIGISKK
jgi:16S rRNA C1402 N4-methylase RsmH